MGRTFSCFHQTKWILGGPEFLGSGGVCLSRTLAVFGALAELERENILERQAEGIAIAKAEGRMNGRPRKAVDTFESVYLDTKTGKLSASEGGRQLGISRSTGYRKAREYEDDNKIIDL